MKPKDWDLLSDGLGLWLIKKNYNFHPPRFEKIAKFDACGPEY